MQKKPCPLVLLQPRQLPTVVTSSDSQKGASPLKQKGRFVIPKTKKKKVQIIQYLFDRFWTCVINTSSSLPEQLDHTLCKIHLIIIPVLPSLWTSPSQPSALFLYVFVRMERPMSPPCFRRIQVKAAFPWGTQHLANANTT